MEPAAAARGGSLVRVRIALAYNSAQGPRRVVGAGLAAPGRRRVLVASLLEPLEPLSLAQEGAVALVPEAGEEAHGDVVTSGEISSPPDDLLFPVIGKTVRVRFVLKKQCTFGQSFHLVGDDPALGLWDSSKAVALDWSEGHDWTVEKDLPANMLIEFKFLVQDSSGKFHWQNGPNRSLQTGDTANTLVVYEDWGDVKNQKITEDGHVSVGMEVVIVKDDGESRKDVVSAYELQLDDNQEVKEDESSVGFDDEKSTVATNASVKGKSVKAHEANQQELMMDELKIQAELHEKVDTAPQNGSVATCADDDYAERTDDDSILSEDGVESGWTGAFEQDMLWGWKALQQLLMSLGFKMDAT